MARKGWVLEYRQQPFVYYGDSNYHDFLTTDINDALLIRDIERFRNSLKMKDRRLRNEYGVSLAALGSGRLDQEFSFVSVEY